MSARTILVVVLALACGLLAFLGVAMMNKGGRVAEVATRPVVYVAADIRRGEPIKKEMLELRQVPKEGAPAAALESLDLVVERVAKIPMLKDDVVTEPKLEPKGARSRIVPPGKRAFTISKADMPPLEVDDHVDIHFTLAAVGTQPAQSNLVENVLVWDVDSAPAKGSEPGAIRAVTILVDSESANLLNQGLNSGTLRLFRRNPGETTRPPVVAKPPAPAVLDALAGDIPAGMRAFTIPTPHLPPSLAQHIHPGDKLDIYFTGEFGMRASPKDKTGGQERPGKPVTFLLMAEVLVKEVGASTFTSGPNSDPSTSRFLTLFVPSEKIALLNLAYLNGTLHFALRNPEDTRSSHDPVTIDDLTPESYRPNILTTRTLRGTSLGSDSLTIQKAGARFPPGEPPSGSEVGSRGSSASAHSTQVSGDLLGAAPAIPNFRD
jgi:Flp pilus assembly protein CpaB